MNTCVTEKHDHGGNMGSDPSQLAAATCAYALCFHAAYQHLSQSATSPPAQAIPSSWLSDMTQTIQSCSSHIAGDPTPPADNTTADEKACIEVEQRWEHKRDVMFAKCSAIDEMMKMIGLTAVKREMINIYDMVEIEKKRGGDPKKIRYHARMEGNPGTGKTTVARLYGGLLCEVGAIEGKAFEETSGSKLADGGSAELTKILDKMYKAKGGVLFVDEAYQLNPAASPGGRSALDLLLTEMENKVGELVVVFAGYSKDMIKLLEYNEGLNSRFATTFKFEDYSNNQLLQILQGIITEGGKKLLQPFTIQEGPDGRFMTIAAKRIGAGRGQRGFGNARAVKNAWEQILRRQTSRLAQEASTSPLSQFELIQSDLVGMDPNLSISDCTPYHELKIMIGLSHVKQTVDALVETIKHNYNLELQMKPTRQLALNGVFLGNPGTGKTTVAKLYGAILKHLNLLSKGDVIVKTPSDFIGSVLGESEKKTRAILHESEGCVLVIDEAYGLAPANKGSSDPYKEAVINELVATIQNVPGEDRAVLLLGYKEEMKEMLNNCNPGLARRFDLSSAFIFQDYTDSELMKILNLKLKQKRLGASMDARMTAIDILNKQRRLPNFGNGGAIENLISQAIPRYHTRIKNIPFDQHDTCQLEPQDFIGPEQKINIDDAFKDMIGCSNVITILKEMHAHIKLKMKQGKSFMQDLELNFLFTGPPGTGKTTIAKRMGLIFHSLGILGTTEIEIHTASDLTGQYLGQTSPKVRELFKKSVGKVLLIDEAYRLNGMHSYGKEAIDEIVNLLTEDAYKQKMVVILAGYENEINELINSNPGLRSRFTRRIPFIGFTPDDCWSLLTILMKKENKILPSQHQHVQQLMTRVTHTSGFGSGRDMETLARKLNMYAEQQQSSSSTTTDEPITISQPQLEHVLTQFVTDVESRAPVASSRTRPTSTPSHMLNPATSTSSPTTTAPPSTTVNQPSTKEDPSKPAFHEPPLSDGGVSRDAGVSDQVWWELQQARRAQEAEEKRIQEELEKLRQKRELEEKERQRLRELEKQREKQAAIQQKLQSMGVCPMGYQWIKMGGGYGCAGGSHWMSDAQLGL